MLEISFLAAELTFLSIWLLVRIVVWIKQKKILWKREAVLLLMAVNLAVMIRFAFFPKEEVNGQVQPLVFDPDAMFPFRVYYVPFIHLFAFKSVGDTIWNVLGNVVMFIPSGIILPVIDKKLNRFGKVVAAGACISLCIELLQLPFASRVTDIDDLILNTLGVMIGYGIYAAFKRIRNGSSLKGGRS